MHADADRVGTHKALRCKRVGDVIGTPATGRKVMIEGGQLKEHWNAVDAAGLIGQLTAPSR